MPVPSLLDIESPGHDPTGHGAIVIHWRSGTTLLLEALGVQTPHLPRSVVSAGKSAGSAFPSGRTPPSAPATAFPFTNSMPNVADASATPNTALFTTPSARPEPCHASGAV